MLRKLPCTSTFSCHIVYGARTLRRLQSACEPDCPAFVLLAGRPRRPAQQTARWLLTLVALLHDACGSIIWLQCIITCLAENRGEMAVAALPARYSSVKAMTAWGVGAPARVQQRTRVHAAEVSAQHARSRVECAHRRRRALARARPGSGHLVQHQHIRELHLAQP